MKGIKISIRFGLCMAALVAAMSFILSANPKEENGSLILDIAHYVGPTILKLDDETYKNALDQTFTISKFKYYIGNIELKRKDGSVFKSDDFFLVNEEAPESKRIQIKSLPSGEYTSLSFIVGVDSVHNVSGAQNGALDPVNAMFWTWSTGYIFLKLEGHADASASPGHIFEYHIGGYKEPSNCIRRINVNLQKQPLVISAGEKTISLKADVLEILQRPTLVDFSKLSSVTDHHNATTIADNYLDLFTVVSIK